MYRGPKQIGDYNKNRLLSILRERGPTSRVELSRLLGISPTAVTRNISRMLKNGVIRECKAEESDMGRKPVPVELCNDFCYILGADIVGGTLKTALVDLTGTIVKYYEEPVRQNEGAEAVVEQLLAELRKIIDEAGKKKKKIWVATIGTPGIFDPAAGKSQFTFFLDGWDDIDIRAKVFDALSVETLIENDVNLDIVGESWKGIGRDYENILYVKLGQGLAGRIVLHNKLLRGEHNMAGEIGYMLPGISPAGNVNYENMICNESVSKRYLELGGKGKSAGIVDLCRLADNGDETAKAVIDYMLDQFALVLLNSAAVLDPEVIILGGDACYFGEKEITFLKQRIEQYLPLTQNIVPSKLNNKACLFGAIKTGLSRVEERITDIW
jgi:glucokinase